MWLFAVSANFDTKNDGKNNDAGGIANPPPPRGTTSLGEQLAFSMDLSEQGAFVVNHQLDQALSSLSVEFENWHDLPLPPESRPVPR